jgi:hypothetical protein
MRLLFKLPLFVFCLRFRLTQILEVVGRSIGLTDSTMSLDGLDTTNGDQSDKITT